MRPPRASAVRSRVNFDNADPSAGTGMPSGSSVMAGEPIAPPDAVRGAVASAEKRRSSFKFSCSVGTLTSINAGQDSNVGPRNCVSCRSDSSMAPERTDEAPKCSDDTFHDSRSQRTTCGDMAGVRLLPRSNDSMAAVACFITSPESTSK